MFNNIQPWISHLGVAVNRVLVSLVGSLVFSALVALHTRGLIKEISLGNYDTAAVFAGMITFTILVAVLTLILINNAEVKKAQSKDSHEH